MGTSAYSCLKLELLCPASWFTSLPAFGMKYTIVSQAFRLRLELYLSALLDPELANSPYRFLVTNTNDISVIDNSGVMRAYHLIILVCVSIIYDVCTQRDHQIRYFSEHTPTVKQHMTAFVCVCVYTHTHTHTSVGACSMSHSCPEPAFLLLL
jgi:hypothetical protein